ncbi:MAG: hypothetical protein HY805_05685, partial [Nitrospirae bacterium]|nr:hypothetical protein [Nitrospirota bacterium]
MNWLNRPFIHLILIAILGILSYSNTFNVPFQWDEQELIENNPIVKNLSYFLEPSKAKGFEFYNALKSRYIGYLTFALNYKLHGFDVTGYHVFNITIHILNALLVYFLVVLTFRTPYLSNPPSSPFNKGGKEGDLEKGGYIALFSALLFVSHPIQTEAVTYIFQRLASLCAFFYLLSLVLYIKWRLQVTLSLTLPHQGGGKWWGRLHYFRRLSPSPNPLPRGEGVRGRVMPLLLYLASLLSAILAMKTKENAFTLPIVITLYEFFFFKGSLGKRVLYLIPLLLTMLIIPLTLIGIDKPV